MGHIDVIIPVSYESLKPIEDLMLVIFIDIELNSWQYFASLCPGALDFFFMFICPQKKNIDENISI